MISAIIPTYNRAALTLEALDSVKAQTFRPIEIVVVDDGSTDNTVASVQAWAHQHTDDTLTLELVTQGNKGGNAARNSGIASSSNEIVALLDSDDTWSPGKLEKQFQLLTDSPQVGAVYCGLVEVAADGISEITREERSYPAGHLYPEILVRDMTAPTSCYMIRKHVLLGVGGFDESLQARQDWDLWIRIAQVSLIVAVEDCLVKYRSHDGARTRSDHFREVHAYQHIRKKYEGQLRQQSLALRRRALGAYHARVGRVMFHSEGDASRAFSHYVRAIYYAPLELNSHAALFGMLLPSTVRSKLRCTWNRVFGRTPLAIRSH